MSLFSVLRGASYLARDIMPALRRFAEGPDDDSPDAYADHLARLHADALAEREAETEVAEPDERLVDCGLGGVDPQWKFIGPGSWTLPEIVIGDGNDKVVGVRCSDGVDRVEVVSDTEFQHLLQGRPPRRDDPLKHAAELVAELYGLVTELASAAPGTTSPDAAADGPAAHPDSGAAGPLKPQ